MNEKLNKEKENMEHRTEEEKRGKWNQTEYESIADENQGRETGRKGEKGKGKGTNREKKQT